VDGKSGRVLKLNNASDLAETITEMFKDKSMLNEMGRYAKHLSETKYSWQDIAKQTIQIYSSVIR